LASTIVKLEDDNWTVMREGPITEEMIRAAIQEGSAE
jgi:tRNA A37 threonylcarbamoyladenosine synthetase subunit TsaC/SUA5/YrdC